MVPAYKTLSLRKDGPVDWLTLDRPHALNTLTIDMVEELGRYFGALEVDSSVRVVVLRGAAGQFCAGLDLKDMGPRLASMDVTAMYAFQRRAQPHRARHAAMSATDRCAARGRRLRGRPCARACLGYSILRERCGMNAAFHPHRPHGMRHGASYLMQRLVGASVAAEVLMTGRFSARSGRRRLA